MLTVCCEMLGYALAGLLIFLLWMWVNRPRTNIPGPIPLPVIGNVLYFRKLPVLLEHFRKLQRSYGDVFRFYAGPKLFVVVTRPEDAKRLLVGVKMRSRDDYAVTPLIPFTGDGLITNKGKVWKEHRRLIEPTFHAELMKDFMEQFNEGADFVCEQLAAAAGAEYDVTRMLLHAMLNVVTASIFGKRINEIEPDVQKQAEIANVFIEALKLMQKRLFIPWLNNEWILSILPEGKQLRQQTSLVNRTIQQAIDIMKNRNTVHYRKRKSFLDVMVDADGNFILPEKEVSDEVRSLAIAGTETAATTLGNALVLLALHPEWQEAVWKEVDEVFKEGGDYLRPCTESDLSKFKIMEAVLKETLRLYPPIPNAPVNADEDIQLEGTDYVIPRDSLALVSLILLHRQPGIFPDPDKFDPGRFLEGGSACSLPPFSYLPFGAGSRKCVGGRYAFLEMKTVLAGVLRRFRVLPGSTREELEQVEISITGSPVTGFRVVCVPRSQT